MFIRVTSLARIGALILKPTNVMLKGRYRKAFRVAGRSRPGRHDPNSAYADRHPSLLMHFGFTTTTGRGAVGSAKLTVGFW